MKKAFKIIGIILLIIIVALSGVAIWQRDKLVSIYKAYKYTPEEIQSQLDSSQEAMKKNIEKETGIKFRDFTDEELAEIQSGKKTKTEIFEKIMNETLEKYMNKNSNVQNKKDKTQKDLSAKVSYDAIVAKYVAQFYSLEGKYKGMLEGLISQAKSDFYSLPSKERTVDTRTTIIKKYISTAAGYESSCDGEVNALLTSFKSELQSIGADTSVVATIKETYTQEKRMQISYYMSQMK